MKIVQELENETEHDRFDRMSKRKGYNISRVSSGSQPSFVEGPVEIRNSDLNSGPHHKNSIIDAGPIEQHHEPRTKTKSALSNKTAKFSKLR